MQTETQSIETPLPKSPDQPNLGDVIAQSTATLEEAKAPKRGRGRPVGWRKNPGAEAGPSPQSDGAAPKASRIQHNDVVKINEIEPLACEICKAPFDFIGWKAGVELTPSDDETKAPAKYLSKLIDAYIPDLESKDPKIFAWAAFGISYLLLAIKKMRILFAQKKAEKNEVANTVTNEKGEQVFEQKTNLNLPAESFPASSVFRRG